MFLMTCDITIGSFKPIKPNGVTWKKSIDTFSDTAVVKLPAIARLKTTGDSYDNVQTGLQFKEGMPVTINAGYDGKNKERFKGFVRRINFSVPLEIECEGYSYLLRQIKDYSKSYRTTTVKQLLKDLVQGTVIKISDKIPEIPLEKIVFKNASGIDVLDYLKKKCLLSVYFNGNILYAGLAETEPKATVKFTLGWNVIKDNELKFEAKKENAEVKIKLQKSQMNGFKKTAEHGPKDGNVKVIRVRHIDDQKTLNAMAEAQKNKLVNVGYEGKILAFLEPIVEPGNAAFISDEKYPERTGLYFIDSVEGSFNTSGGRQKIGIGASLSNG